MAKNVRNHQWTFEPREPLECLASAHDIKAMQSQCLFRHLVDVQQEFTEFAAKSLQFLCCFISTFAENRQKGFTKAKKTTHAFITLLQDKAV